MLRARVAIREIAILLPFYSHLEPSIQIIKRLYSSKAVFGTALQDLATSYYHGTQVGVRLRFLKERDFDVRII